MSIVNENGELDFSSDSVKKINAELEKRFAEIEHKHAAYFQSRKAFDYTQDHDNIRNHIWTYTDNKNFYNLGFLNDSDLDAGIRQEVIDAFNQAAAPYQK